MLSWICRSSSYRSSHCLHNFPFFPSISVVSFSTSTSKTLIDNYLVSHHHFSPGSAANVSSSLPGKFIFNPQNTDSVLNFFKETGFSQNQIETVVLKRPRLLSANVETSIEPKITVFQDLGFRLTDFSEILTACPWYLESSSHRLQHSILVLKNVLGCHDSVCKLLKNPSTNVIFSGDLATILVPNIEHLESYGIDSSKIVTYVCRHPRVFLRKPEILKDFVKRADEMGVPRKSRNFIAAVYVIGSVPRKNCEMKLKIFRELGFSEQNILHAFREMPSVFHLSERKIREVTQLLLCVEDISYIARFPQLYNYSVEKRLKPRLRVLKALESNNLLKERPSLYSFCHMTDAKFMMRYVTPYSGEIQDLYAAREDSLPSKLNS